MDDTTPPADPKKDFNTLDLSQLQAFSFGTQWAQDKPERNEGGNRGPRDRDGQGREDRPRRDGPGGPDRRDRRAFKRPAGAPGGPGPGGGGAGGGAGPQGGEGRPPRFAGGPDRGPRQGGDERRGRPEGGFAPRGRAAPMDRMPYQSPYFDVTFYPEDTSFESLAKTIRASCRTFELFDIARTVIGKNDRFVAVIQHKRSAGNEGGGEAGGAPRSKPRFYISLPDGALFDTEDGAVTHVTRHHLGAFFDEAVVEVDPPKGSFQVINKCGVTGALLGPPNYHRYAQAVQTHHAAHAAHMPLEAYRNRIETVRDPEVVTAWLESMKKITRYTWKTAESEAKKASAVEKATEATPATAEAATEAPVETPAAESAEVDATPSTPEAAPAEAAATEEATTSEAAGPYFDSIEDAKVYLLTHARERVVRAVDSGRFHGKLLENLPDGEIKWAVLGALERQRKFPLDTANALRGRLRREGFTIFKKGSKGVSYVCAVKRKFRLPGQTFAESIGELIDFIESHPLVKASELPEKFLGYTPEAGGETPAVVDQARLNRLQGDLRWLVTEGYVTEFLNGGLFAPPAMVAPKSGSSDDEPDGHEEFPEAQAQVTAAPASGSAETPEPAADVAPAQPGPEPEAEPAAVVAPVESTPPAAPEAASAETVPAGEPVATPMAEAVPTEAAPSEETLERKPNE